MEEFYRERQIELRSPEVQEIIGQIPGSVIRYGTVVITGVLVCLLFISWFIRYSDVLSATVVVTTTPPPVTLVARASGPISILKRENELVEKGDLIAIVRSTVDVQSVLNLEQILAGDTKGHFEIEQRASLGDLEPYYRSWWQAKQELQLFEGTQPYAEQIAQLNRQRNTLFKLSKILGSQQVVADQELLLAREKFNTDSLLYHQHVTAALDFNQAKATWLQQVKAARGVQASIIQNEVQINQLGKQIVDLQLQHTEQNQKLRANYQLAKYELRAQIDKWKEAYLVISPTNGRFAHLRLLEDDKFVEAGSNYSRHL
ncbi:MAG: hypothetical protein ACOYXA_05640 [Bacteroidota bacterium]